MADPISELKSKAILAFLIIVAIILDGLIVSTILIVGFMIKTVAALLHMESDVLTTNIDQITQIGSLIIFALWMLWTVISIIKYMKNEILSPNNDISSEPEVTDNATNPSQTRRTNGCY